MLLLPRRLTPLLLGSLFALACAEPAKPPPPLDLQASSFTVDRTEGIVANGVDPLRARVKLVDAAGKPIVGAQVNFAAQDESAPSSFALERTGAADELEPPLYSFFEMKTNAAGVAEVQFVNTAAVTLTLRVSVLFQGERRVLLQRHRVTWVPGPLARLAFVRSPTSALVGEQLGPLQVVPLDAQGNPVRTSGTVTLSTSSTSQQLLGTQTAPLREVGGAVFDDVRIQQPGVTALRAQLAGGAIEGWSTYFEVTFGDVASFAFAVPPGDVQAGQLQALPVRVVALNRVGAIIPLNADNVSLTLEGLRAGCLGGTTARWAEGMVSYPDLVVRCTGTGLRLRASLRGTVATSSPPFAVTPGPVSWEKSWLRALPQWGVADGTSPVAVQLRLADAFGNPVPDVPVTLSAAGPTPTLTLPTPMRTDMAGRLTATLTSPASGTVSLTALAATSTFGASVSFGSPCAATLQLPAFPVVRTSAGLLLTGDFDGDGRADVFTGSELLLNDGRGWLATYGAPVASPYLNASSVEDMDGDGAPDLLSMRYTLELHLNRGDGTFLPPQPLTDYSVSASRIFTGDFNGDGRKDVGYVLPAWYGTPEVKVLLQDASGGFSAPVTTPLTSTPSALVAAELDGQPGTDLVALGAGGVDVTLLGSTGAGSFAVRTVRPLSGTPAGLAVGDVTGDGRSDVVIGEAQEAQLWVLPGNGDGTLGAPQGKTLLAPSPLLVLADVDADGRRDVVTAATAGPVSVLRQGKDGQLLGPTIVTELPVDALAAADLTGDGRPELLLRRGETVVPLPNHGDGTFAAPRTLAPLAYPVGLATGDLNEDGQLDAVIANRTQVQLALSTPDVGHVVRLLPVEATGITAVALGDVDRDGHADLLLTDDPSSRLLILRGRGDGSFTAAAPLAISPRPRALAVADLSGDGAPEVVVAAAELRVLRNDGQGGLTAEAPLAAEATAAVVGDFDGDGDLDLAAALAASSTTTELRVLHNDGTGTLAAEAPLPAYWGTVSLDVADVDGDGRQDVVVGQPGYGIQVLRGGGDAELAPHPRIYGASGSAVVAAGDMDGDGHVDLLARQEGELSLLLGQGGLTFALAPRHVQPQGGGPLLVRDWDGDGRLDVLSGAGGFTVARSTCAR